MLLELAVFRLQPLLAQLKTTPARIAEEPDAIRGRLAVRSAQSGFTQRRLKSFLRLRRIARHEKTKTVELREVLIRFQHA